MCKIHLNLFLIIWLLVSINSATQATPVEDVDADSSYTLDTPFADENSQQMIPSPQAIQDLNPPEFIHLPPSDDLEQGDVFRIETSVTDNVGIQSVTVYFRTQGEMQYRVRDIMLVTVWKKVYQRY